MTTAELMMPTYYLHQIADELEKDKVDSKRWLAAVGLNIQQIDQPDQMIPFRHFKKLISTAVDLSNQAALGLKVGQRLGLTTHGMLGYAIIVSSCLRETVELFSRYLNTRTPLLRVKLVNHSQTLKIELHECYPLENIKIPFLETALLTLYKMLMQVTQNSAVVESIAFPFKQPTYIESYQSIFTQPLFFEASVASISLSQEGLDSPLPMGDPNSLAQAKLICEQELIKLQNQEEFQSRVRKYLLSHENQFPNLISVARYFNMSQRTLDRRLKKNHTRYSEILASVRQYKATEMLCNSNMSIQQIAANLGYSDSASFRKAFKRWRDCSPSEYRENREN